MNEFKGIRIGQGYDIHKFVEGRLLWLGGIQIPYHLGLEGHSDADVLLHAICDALLGALNLRDIGFHFPNNDPEFKNIDSKKLLEKTMNLVYSHGYGVGNIDCTIIAEEPKINPYIPQMQKTLYPIVRTDTLSIKATTNEGLGSLGRKEGIAALAVAILYKADFHPQ